MINKAFKKREEELKVKEDLVESMRVELEKERE
jgi:hypothetical protein